MILANKIRLGAPDSMVLFQTIDLGASSGGIELTYTPTYFNVEIDQSVMPLKAYRTKEEIIFSFAAVQYQMSLIAAAFGYPQTNISTVAGGSLTTAATPTAVVNGTPGVVSYSYEIVAFSSDGDGIPSVALAVTTGPAVLTSANSITLSWAAVTGAAGYKIIRSASAGSPSSTGLIGTVYGNTLTFTDTGLAATTYTPSATNPTYPNSDKLLFGGSNYATIGAFDWSVPKNDGTTRHLRGHLNQVYSSRAVKLDYKRDKHSDIAKLELFALADATQPVGQQAGFLIEEY